MADNRRTYFFLRQLFEQLPLAETEDDYRSLLPQNLSPDQIVLPAA